MSRETSPTRDDMISDDVRDSLDEAYDLVQKFFGTPETQDDKTPLEYEEDKRLKEFGG